MNAGEQKALDDIEKHGLHIINVMEEGDLPLFAYSIGIEKSLGQPELIVVGLKRQLAGSVINKCYRQMAAGLTIDPGAMVADLIDGFGCRIGAVAPAHFDEYMGWALWLYDGPNFRARQIIFPNTAGAWPWEKEANEWFRNWQPLLAGIE